MSYHIAAALLGVIWWTAPVLAEGFLCAGSQGAPPEEALPAGVAAKPAQTAPSRTTGTRRALVLFARFKGEPANPVPSWAADLFNPDLPGSFSHFYDIMSFGKLEVRGEVGPRVYESSQSASAYLPSDPTEQGQFGRFALEILRQADRDTDFAQFDDDGPDGIPNSGDDDGVVDAVFLVVGRIPARFLLSEATGIASLGFEGPFATADTGTEGKAIQILPNQGTIQQGRDFAEAVGAICHEYGHVLGLPDLYNTEFLGKKGVGPEDDSAGVGAWCLMGWGATGWNGNDGPNSFCAWSRMQLGWAEVREVAHPVEELRLAEVGKTGQVYQVPVAEREYFLLEYRTQQSTYYDRRAPGAGLLIWHVSTRGPLRVDLECADGNWRDAGFPQGKTPDPRQGGDNLDFWAHDDLYRRAHNGNQGDATDPFDGVRFVAFTPDTNPSSHSLDGAHQVRVEDIRFDGGLALARVQTDSMRLEVVQLQAPDWDSNGILSPNEMAIVYFWLNNTGGITAREVRTILSSADTLVTIDHPETHFGDLGLGPHLRPLRGEQLPLVLLVADPGTSRQVSLLLEVFAGEILLARREFSVQVASSFTWSGRLVDEEGNGLAGVTMLLAGRSVITGEEGVFQATLPPGRHTASIEVSFGAQSYSFDLTEDLESEVVLKTAYPVFGTIRDRQGIPVPYTILNATPVNRTFVGVGYSDNDGAYTLELPKGTYTIAAHVDASAKRKDLPDQTLKNVRIVGPRTLDITLQQGIRLDAQVTDGAGKGVATTLDITSLRYDGFGDAAQLGANAAGMGTQSIVPGVYRVKPRYASSQLAGQSRFLPLFADTAIQMVLNRNFAVAGRIDDESPDLLLTPWLSFLPSFPYTLETGIINDGAYAASLPPGPCQVVLEGTGPGIRLRQLIGDFSVNGSGSADWQVRRSERIEGQMSDEQGNPLAGIEIQALAVDVGMASLAPTRADGSFAFFGPPGEYDLIAVEADTLFYPLGHAAAPLGAPLKLQKPTGTALHGRILDSDGYPVGQAVVLLTRDLATPVKYHRFDQAPRLSVGADWEMVAISGATGEYRLAAEAGSYDLLVLPNLGTGTGRVHRKISLPTTALQETVLPAPERMFRVYGQIAEEPDMPRGELVLQFYDRETGIAAQATDWNYRAYDLDLPPGNYQVRTNMLGPVGGFQKVYHLGGRQVSESGRWDIDLSDVATAVNEDLVTTPQHFSLEPAYPNPFNPTTTLRFTLPQPDEAELAIYNLLGQRVATLVKGMQEAGPHALQWDGRDEQGRELASGVYLYRLQTGLQVETRKLLLLR